MLSTTQVENAENVPAGGGMRFEVHMAASQSRWEGLETSGVGVTAAKHPVFKDYRELVMRNTSNPRSKRDFPIDNFVPVFADSYKAIVLEFLLHNARCPKFENEFFLLTAAMTPQELSSLECVSLPIPHFLARCPNLPEFTRRSVVRIGVAEEGYIDMNTVMSQSTRWAEKLNRKRALDEIQFLSDKIQHHEEQIALDKQRKQELEELDKGTGEEVAAPTPKKTRTFSFAFVDVSTPPRLSSSQSAFSPSSVASLGLPSDLQE